MTDIDKKIAELEELLAKSTLEPWEAHCTNEILQTWRICDATYGYAIDSKDDAALIVAMRNALPELFAEIKRLKGALNIETAGHYNMADELTHMERGRDSALARAEQVRAELDVLFEWCKSSCPRCPAKKDCDTTLYTGDDKEEGCTAFIQEWLAQEAAKRNAREEPCST